MTSQPYTSSVDPFPDQFSLFEVFGNPDLPDPHTPWFYNRLEFRARFGSDDLHVVIEPAGYTFEVTWTVRSRLIADLRPETACGLEVIRDGGVERLRVHLDDERAEPLEVCLTPLSRYGPAARGSCKGTNKGTAGSAGTK